MARGVFSQLIGTYSGRDAANAAQQAAQIGETAELNKQGMLTENYNQARAAAQPYLATGADANQQLRSGLANGSFNTPTFSYNGGPAAPDYGQAPQQFTPGVFDPSKVAQEPGYQFGLNQGLNQIQNSAASGRSLHSGNTMVGLEKYAQDYAGTKLNDAFNRFSTQQNQALGAYQTNLGAYQNNRNFLGQQYQQNRQFGYNTAQDVYNSQRQATADRFNRLSQIANGGQSAQQNLSNLSGAYANNYGNSLEEQANAKAAGIIGAQQAQQQGVNNVTNGIGYLGSKIASFL